MRILIKITFLLFFCKPILADQCLNLHLQKVSQFLKPFDFSSEPLTTGIEIEGVVPKYLGRKGVANELKRFLEQSFGEVTMVKQYGYKLSYIHEGRAYHFEVKNDPTIKNKEGEKAVEITSPILHSKEDVQFFIKAMEHLKDIGFKAEPKSAGVHIHLGFDSPYAAELLLLSSIFSLIDPAMKKEFGVTPERLFRGFIEPLNEGKITQAFEHVSEILALKDIIEIQKWLPNRNDRAVHLLTKHGTLEIRIFNSTLESSQLLKMVEFSQKLMVALRTQNKELINYLVETSSQKVEFRELARILKVETQKWPFELVNMNNHMLERGAHYLKGKKSWMIAAVALGAFYLTFADRLFQLFQDLEENLKPKKPTFIREGRL